MGKVMIRKCLHCGHEWCARVVMPMKCPFCQTKYWNSQKPAVDPKAMAHPKYDVSNLAVGDSLKFMFHSLPDGGVDEKTNRSMSTSIIQYGKRSGRQFGLIGRGANLIVTRLA